ncbi:MAG: apolipoprotein N-acyltransferase, partial [Betaproteobacteria bacterium]|nr:apolipoprotein N-acyltransferase [Betaproteobacteria bacterium]
MRIASLAVVLAYTVGLHWIYISLHEYGGLPSWLAALATLLLSLYVALYALGALALIRWLKLNTRQWIAPFAIAAIVTLAEWCRGTFLTGFPWLAIGYLAIDTPLSGYA